ncbi:hypothetical protein ALO78_200401 [Pseudomonas amygdali pv. ciccaronei]|nr:hypothetical protein ALO78_200401 [Pseudomonas amygdali pv. ciccaronei]
MDPVSLSSILVVCKIILVVTNITILVVDAAIRYM